MSTRSGPYVVSVNDEKWTWEHDMYQTDLLDSQEVFRIYGPGGDYACEVSLAGFKEVVKSGIQFAPMEVIENILDEYDLPKSFAFRHQELWKRGEKCGHCGS